MDSLPIAAFMGAPNQIDRVYAQGRKDAVAARTRLLPGVVMRDNWHEQLPALRQVEVVFATWGMMALSGPELDAMPQLRAVFYAAGSVQRFAAPLLERGITVISAWQANAVPVAEFTLAQMLLATKGYFRNVQDYVSPDKRGAAFNGPGNFGETVALLGAGAIGRLVIELLRPFHLQIAVFDPFLPAEEAARLGVEPVSLKDAFRRGFVVSNHLANLPATVGLLRGEHFAAMRPGAVFINTGRGATVDEAAMIQVLQARPDLTALLDVTHPEPPLADSPLYRLPNVHLSTHIAGSLGDEVVRMADFVLEEFDRWTQGQPLRYDVTAAMLEKMA